jgi:hypothetical protein
LMASCVSMSSKLRKLIYKLSELMLIFGLFALAVAPLYCPINLNWE